MVRNALVRTTWCIKTNLIFKDQGRIEFNRSPKPTSTPTFRPHRICLVKLFSSPWIPQNGTFWGLGFEFGKCHMQRRVMRYLIRKVSIPTPFHWKPFSTIAIHISWITKYSNIFYIKYFCISFIPYFRKLSNSFLNLRTASTKIQYEVWACSAPLFYFEKSFKVKPFKQPFKVESFKHHKPYEHHLKLKSTYLNKMYLN